MENSAELTPQIFQEYIHEALRAWHVVGDKGNSLLNFLMLVKQQRKRDADDHSLAALRRATNQVILDGLETLAERDPEGEKILRERFLNKDTIGAVAFRRNLSQDQINRQQREAISNLSEILRNRELKLREKRAWMLEGKLPPPSYDRLVGCNQAVETLVEQIQRTGPPWIFNVVGLGGIGKTSIADAVTRRILQDFYFDEVVWLRADPQILSTTVSDPAFSFQKVMSRLADEFIPPTTSPLARQEEVRHLLKTTPCLVILDNLEAESEVSYLIEQLRNLSGPSKFLLTSRIQPKGLSGVFIMPVDELSLEDADELIRHYADIRNVPHLADASKSDLQSIYDLVGGNPLGLRLVVELSFTWPLSKILEDLIQVPPGMIEELYRRIYQKVWLILTPPARQLLQTMPLVATNGATFEHLMAASELSEAEFFSAVTELSSRSLLEVRGSLHEKRYGIHRLTETFLRADIIHWPEMNT